MPEDTTAPAAPQAGATVNTPTPGGSTTTPDAQAADGQEQISLDEARKLRKEAQALRTRLNGYEAAEKAAQEAALSEVDKANKRAVELEAKYAAAQKQLVAAQVKIAAQSKGIIDPDIAALAIADKLELGDDGLPTNVEKALDDLIKNKPYLVAKAEQAAPASPAQTNAPAIPVMSPGRSSIQSPGTLAPNKTVSLTDRSIWSNNR